MSLTTSPIFCAAWASPAISSLVVCASATATRTSSVVCSSWRAISVTEASSSSAAAAAASTLSEDSFDVFTAPSARCELWSEEPDSAAAVARMAPALSPTVFRAASTRSRKLRMAASTATRRCSCSASEACFCSALRCSVMSSWVTTHPPSAIGRLASAITRPSPISMILSTALPCAISRMVSATYLSGSPLKVPASMRCRMSSLRLQPGLVFSGDKP